MASFFWAEKWYDNYMIRFDLGVDGRSPSFRLGPNRLAGRGLSTKDGAKAQYFNQTVVRATIFQITSLSSRTCSSICVSYGQKRKEIHCWIRYPWWENYWSLGHFCRRFMFMYDVNFVALHIFPVVSISFHQSHALGTYIADGNRKLEFQICMGFWYTIYIPILGK